MRTFAPKSSSSPFTPTEPQEDSTAPEEAFPNTNGSHNTPASNAPPATSTTSAEDRLSTIRDLLVGDQIEVLNDRFATLENSLQAHSTELVDQIKSKFEAAYNLYKVELDDMGNSVKTLKTNQEETTSDLKRIDERLTQIDKKYEDLKTDLSRQTSELYDEISKNVDQFTTVMKNQYEELAARMVTKTDLANLFGNLSAAAANPQAVVDQNTGINQNT
ncbi:MAG: hypothetical protein AAGD22_09825 [Verrucomicrobiota bacterium]